MESQKKLIDTDGTTTKIRLGLATFFSLEGHGVGKISKSMYVCNQITNGLYWPLMVILAFITLITSVCIRSVSS